MTHDEHARRKARLLSAVSILGASLGVTLAATSAGAAIDSYQPKGDSNHIKGESQQLKYNSQYLKHHSDQIKGEANYLKYNRHQIKGETHDFNPQPDPPGRARGENVP
jgi:hypothetical protein